MSLLGNMNIRVKLSSPAEHLPVNHVSIRQGYDMIHLTIQEAKDLVDLLSFMLQRDQPAEEEIMSAL